MSSCVGLTQYFGNSYFLFCYYYSFFLGGENAQKQDVGHHCILMYVINLLCKYFTERGTNNVAMDNYLLSVHQDLLFTRNISYSEI